MTTSSYLNREVADYEESSTSVNCDFMSSRWSFKLYTSLSVWYCADSASSWLWAACINIYSSNSLICEYTSLTVSSIRVLNCIHDMNWMYLFGFIGNLRPHLIDHLLIVLSFRATHLPTSSLLGIFDLLGTLLRYFILRVNTILFVGVCCRIITLNYLLLASLGLHQFRISLRNALHEEGVLLNPLQHLSLSIIIQDVLVNLLESLTLVNRQLAHLNVRQTMKQTLTDLALNVQRLITR